MAGLLDFLQAASNSAAGTVTAPVDGIAWLLRKAGIPVGEPVGGSDWAKRQGLMRDVPQSAASVAGETFGLLAPVVAAAKAPQIAKGLLQMGENAAAPRTLNPQKGAIVWHGSPHKFDKFDSSKIGTGEGAQAYGHGLYLAESPDVAKSYADSVSRLHGATTTVEGAGKSVPVPLWAADRVRNEGIDSLIAEWTQRLADSQTSAKKSLQPWIEQANAARFAQQLDELQAIKAGGAVKVEAPGSIYKVDLPDSAIARMLDWDAPLSQQAPEVQKAVQGVWDANFIKMVKSGKVPALADANGSDVYTALGKSPEMAAQLRQAGIPGIRYLDGGSRGAGSGTSNFVVFPGEEGLLKILERNGIPLR